MTLTAKQEAFAKAIALDGLTHSDAYRRSYDVSPDSLPSTTWSEANALATENHHVATRIAELKASLVAEAVTDAASLVRELLTVGNVAIDSRNVRAADKVAALDKVAKILGLYKDTEDARSARPPVITNITVILNRGDEKRAENLPGRVVEAASGGPKVGQGVEEDGGSRGKDAT